MIIQNSTFDKVSDGMALNTDQKRYSDYINKRNIHKMQESKINSLESELSEMKELLKQVLTTKVSHDNSNN